MSASLRYLDDVASALSFAIGAIWDREFNGQLTRLDLGPNQMIADEGHIVGIVCLLR